jgi:hypothetical protein
MYLKAQIILNMQVYFKAACLPLNIVEIKYQRDRLCQYFSCGTGHSRHAPRPEVFNQSHSQITYSLSFFSF